MAVNRTKDGRWRVAYRGRNGKWTGEYFPGTDSGKQAAHIRDLEIKLLKQTGAFHPPVTPLDAETFSDLCQAYIAVRRAELSEKTRQEIMRTLAVYALPVIGGKYFRHISMQDWTGIEKNMIDRGITARTINKYFQYISRVFSWAVERDLLPAHPWAKRRPLRIVKKFRIELMTMEEFRRILDHADDHLAWALEVAYHTGMRPGPTELFALCWSDIDFETGAIRIYASKTDSWHTQYVSAEFLQRLAARRQYMQEKGKTKGMEHWATCPYVCSFNGQRVLRMSSAWAAAKRAAGITRRIRLYDIRHFYITHALAAGADLMNLAQRVGHVNANMIVTVYSHLADELKSQKAFNIPELRTGNGARDNA